MAYAVNLDAVTGKITYVTYNVPTAPLPEEQQAQLLAEYEVAIQALVDSKPKERRFRDGVTMASYVASTQPQWAAEAQAFVAWRDQVWLYAYAELEKVMTGQREQPTVEEFLEELPKLDWPELPTGESLESRPSM